MNLHLPDDAKAPDRAPDAWLWFPPEGGARMLKRASTVLVIMLSLSLQIIGADAFGAPVSKTELIVVSNPVDKPRHERPYLFQDRRVTDLLWYRTGEAVAWVFGAGARW